MRNPKCRRRLGVFSQRSTRLVELRTVEHRHDGPRRLRFFFALSVYFTEYCFERRRKSRTRFVIDRNVIVPRQAPAKPIEHVAIEQRIIVFAIFHREHLGDSQLTRKHVEQRIECSHLRPIQHGLRHDFVLNRRLDHRPPPPPMPLIGIDLIQHQKVLDLDPHALTPPRVIVGLALWAKRHRSQGIRPLDD